MNLPRREFLVGLAAGLALSGCVTGAQKLPFLAAYPALPRVRPARYDAVLDEPFPIPAVDVSAVDQRFWRTIVDNPMWLADVTRIPWPAASGPTDAFVSAAFSHVLRDRSSTSMRLSATPRSIRSFLPAADSLAVPVGRMWLAPPERRMRASGKRRLSSATLVSRFPPSFSETWPRFPVTCVSTAPPSRTMPATGPLICAGGKRSSGAPEQSRADRSPAGNPKERRGGDQQGPAPAQAEKADPDAQDRQKGDHVPRRQKKSRSLETTKNMSGRGPTRHGARDSRLPA